MKNLKFTHSIDNFSEEWYKNFSSSTSVEYKLIGNNGREVIEIRKINDTDNIAIVFKERNSDFYAYVKSVDFFEKTVAPKEYTDKSISELLDDVMDCFDKKPAKEKK